MVLCRSAVPFDYTSTEISPVQIVDRTTFLLHECMEGVRSN